MEDRVGADLELLLVIFSVKGIKGGAELFSSIDDYTQMGFTSNENRVRINLLNLD